LRNPLAVSVRSLTGTVLHPVTRRTGESVEAKGTVRHVDCDKWLTRIREERIIIVPMARIFTAERTLQGQALSSFGAYACQAGSRLHSELKPGRRDTANTGRPVVRW